MYIAYDYDPYDHFNDYDSEVVPSTLPKYSIFKSRLLLDLEASEVDEKLLSLGVKVLNRISLREIPPFSPSQPLNVRVNILRLIDGVKCYKYGKKYSDLFDQYHWQIFSLLGVNYDAWFTRDLPSYAFVSRLYPPNSSEKKSSEELALLENVRGNLNNDSGYYKTFIQSGKISSSKKWLFYLSLLPCRPDSDWEKLALQIEAFPLEPHKVWYDLFLSEAEFTLDNYEEIVSYCMENKYIMYLLKTSIADWSHGKSAYPLHVESVVKYIKDFITIMRFFPEHAKRILEVANKYVVSAKDIPNDLSSYEFINFILPFHKSPDLSRERLEIAITAFGSFEEVDIARRDNGLITTSWKKLRIKLTPIAFNHKFLADKVVSNITRSNWSDAKFDVLLDHFDDFYKMHERIELFSKIAEGEQPIFPRDILRAIHLNLNQLVYQSSVVQIEEKNFIWPELP